MYNKAFVISKKKWEEFLRYCSWNIIKYNLIEQIDENIEQIFITPFSQAKEKWFNVKSSWEKVISILVKEKKEFSFEEFEKTFEEKEINLEWELKEHFSKNEYEEIVKSIIKDEIWNGEWSNFCIAQKIFWEIKDFDINKALSIFKNILSSEYWSYLQFIFFDWKEFFIWASPERNISVENNIVRMNPISWTFRKIWYKNYLDFKKDFIKFLDDKKEINELFMSVDEELKMMSKICSSWWIIVWPILKEMANLIHTEYLLSWKSEMKKLDIFRETMWACTVVWSPIENAFKIIKKYENFNRAYYAWAISYLENGNIDSSIMIRTLNIGINWHLEACVWASLVKDSIPENEYFEIKAKLKWVLNAISWTQNKKISFLEKYYLDDEVQELLQKRNQHLSKTWFFKQDIKIQNRKENILIINNEDDFTNMIAHILKILWFKTILKNYFEIEKEDLEKNDLVLIWPWPWNPLDNSEKVLKILEIIDYLNKNNKKYFWICFWHQLICRYLNILLRKKEIPTQWEQIEIDLFWKKEKVAFYNTFAWFDENISSLKEINFSKEKTTWEIFAIRWKNFFSFQFHPESILTQNWVSILKEEIENILKSTSP